MLFSCMVISGHELLVVGRNVKYHFLNFNLPTMIIVLQTHLFLIVSLLRQLTLLVLENKK